MSVPLWLVPFGYVYILHFSRPLGNPSNRRAMAQHYAGFSIDPLARFSEHKAGSGAKITRAAVQQGIDLVIVDYWPAVLLNEYEIKTSVKNTPKLCVLCCQIHGWNCRAPEPAARQLATVKPLTLEEVEDFPAIPAGRDRMDGYEFAYMRRFARVTSFKLTNLDGGDIPY